MTPVIPQSPNYTMPNLQETIAETKNILTQHLQHFYIPNQPITEHLRAKFDRSMLATRVEYQKYCCCMCGSTAATKMDLAIFQKKMEKFLKKRICGFPINYDEIKIVTLCVSKNDNDTYDYEEWVQNPFSNGSKHSFIQMQRAGLYLKLTLLAHKKAKESIGQRIDALCSAEEIAILKTIAQVSTTIFLDIAAHHLHFLGNKTISNNDDEPRVIINVRYGNFYTIIWGEITGIKESFKKTQYEIMEFMLSRSHLRDAIGVDTVCIEKRDNTYDYIAFSEQFSPIRGLISEASICERNVPDANICHFYKRRGISYEEFSDIEVLIKSAQLFNGEFSKNPLEANPF